LECLSLEDIFINSKSCIGSKLSGSNYKRNLTSRNTFVFFSSFIGNICIFKYSHIIELGEEGQKVAPQSNVGPCWPTSCIIGAHPFSHLLYRAFFTCSLKNGVVTSVFFLMWKKAMKWAYQAFWSFWTKNMKGEEVLAWKWEKQRR
jgi:hypothetical protein